MAKQKNDLISAQQKRVKRLKITAIMLIVVAIGLCGVFLSAPRIDAQALSQYIDLPEEAQIFTPVCISIDYAFDPAAPINAYSQLEIMEWSELFVNGTKIPSDQIETWMTFNYPGSVFFCVMQGLDQGQYQMEFRLKDSVAYDIAVYQWDLTVKP